MTVTSGHFEDWMAALDEDLSPDGANDFLLLLKAGGTLKNLKPDTMTALAGGIPISGWVPAGEVWTYEAGDDPTYTFSEPIDATLKYYPGMRIKCTQGGSVKYGIVTKVGAYSGGKTIITAYCGTDYDLGATITLPYYSPIKAPQGFPLDPAKWTVTTTDVSERTQASPTQNTWYNLNSNLITLPIGIWYVDWQATGDCYKAAASSMQFAFTLSTGNNNESDAELSAEHYTSSVVESRSTLHRSKTLAVASKTAYYFNMRTTSASIANIFLAIGGACPTILRAICAYL